MSCELLYCQHLGISAYRGAHLLTIGAHSVTRRKVRRAPSALACRVWGIHITAALPTSRGWPWWVGVLHWLHELPTGVKAHWPAVIASCLVARPCFPTGVFLYLLNNRLVLISSPQCLLLGGCRLKQMSGHVNHSQVPCKEPQWPK